jgi:hypothetical protein
MEPCQEKPTLEQVAWIFEQINENAGGSFRKLIYDRLGFGPTAYSELYSAGGQNITNAMCIDSCLLREVAKTKEDVIDSLVSQIEVLRPVYEAAKILRGACFFGKRENIEAASAALRRAVDVAARELEDSGD